MVEDLKKFENESVVGEDSRSLELTHYVLAERLMQVEHSGIQKEMNKHVHSDTLVYILDGGFRAFQKMSPGELWSEWKDGAEDTWYQLYEDNELPWETYEDDPIHQLEEDENGEVAKG